MALSPKPGRDSGEGPLNYVEATAVDVAGLFEHGHGVRYRADAAFRRL
ncbi:MAG: hypothetical protein WAS73_19055 [Defluviicoccus sp.]